MTPPETDPAPRRPDLTPDELARIFSVEDFEPLAAQRMHPTAYAYIRGWAGSGWTWRQNVLAWRHWVLRPRALVDVSSLDVSTTVLGTPISVPIMFAPTSIHKIAHPDGELATARAAKQIDTLQVLSTGASTTFEDVAAIGQKRWLQLYWFNDREITRSLVERAHAAGFGAIVLTVDAPVEYWRENELRVPLVKPDGMSQPNVPTGLNLIYDPTLTWTSLEWLRSISPLPIVLKGILRADDAVRAVEHGAAGILVSNHGGRELDTSTSTIEALPSIAEAVDGRIEVYVDGGVRRGTDVLKALALGARAVLVGRQIQWALAVGGDAGIVRLFELMTGEFTSAMALCGARNVGEITPSVVRRNLDRTVWGD